MATRSRIGYQYEDGSIKSIYCHFDGYPSYVGKMLEEHYSNPQKIRELIELGDISQLKPEIGEKQDFNNPTSKDWCLAYGRDRGEEGCEAERHHSLFYFLQHGKGSCAEYCYLWDGVGWNIYNPYGNMKTIVQDEA